MAQTYSLETDGALDVAQPRKMDAHIYGGKLKRMRATIPLAAQAADDTVVLGDLPAGASFAFCVLTATATLGATATIAIGTAAAPGKYREAATFTTSLLQGFGEVDAVAAAPLTAPERVILTVGAAALPASGTLVVDIFYSDLA